MYLKRLQPNTLSTAGKNFTATRDIKLPSHQTTHSLAVSRRLLAGPTDFTQFPFCLSDPIDKRKYTQIALLLKYSIQITPRYGSGHPGRPFPAQGFPCAGDCSIPLLGALKFPLHVLWEPPISWKLGKRTGITSVSGPTSS